MHIVLDVEGAVVGGEGKDVSMARAPDGGVDAVGLLLEGSEVGGARGEAVNGGWWGRGVQ